MKQNWLNDNIKPILAITVVVLTFAYFFYCAAKGIKPDPQILIAIVGSIGTTLGYYFGYSQGAAKKDEVIASQTSSPTVTNAETVNVDQTKL